MLWLIEVELFDLGVDVLFFISYAYLFFIFFIKLKITLIFLVLYLIIQISVNHVFCFRYIAANNSPGMSPVILPVNSYCWQDITDEFFKAVRGKL